MSPIYTLKNYTPEESIGFLLKRAGGALTVSLDRELAAYDMTHAQLGIFIRLMKGEARTAAELARGQVGDSGAMTRMLDRLEEKGFVERCRHPEDRRVIHVHLTDKGEQMAELMIKTAMNTLNHFLRDFTPDEIELFKGFLRRMIANA